MPPPIVVVGAGSIGCCVAARLARQQDVSLVARPATAAAIAAQGGLRIEGRHAGRYDVRVLRRLVVPAAARVIVAVKAYDLERVLATLAPQLGPDAQVLLLQNGLGIATLARRILGRPVPRAIIALAATRLAPGHVRWTAGGTSLLPRSSGFGGLWRQAGLPVRVVADLRPHVWQKAAVNGVVNPMSALLGVENGALLALRVAPRAVLAEIVRVAATYGQPLRVAPLERHVRRSMRRTARNTSSMLQDVRAGRPTEIDWLNGAVVRLGNAHGIATPCNAALADLVRARAAQRPRR